MPTETICLIFWIINSNRINAKFTVYYNLTFQKKIFIVIKYLDRNLVYLGYSFE